MNRRSAPVIALAKPRRERVALYASRPGRLSRIVVRLKRAFLARRSSSCSNDKTDPLDTRPRPKHRRRGLRGRQRLGVEETGARRDSVAIRRVAADSAMNFSKHCTDELRESGQNTRHFVEPPGIEDFWDGPPCRPRAAVRAGRCIRSPARSRARLRGGAKRDRIDERSSPGPANLEIRFPSARRLVVRSDSGSTLTREVAREERVAVWTSLARNSDDFPHVAPVRNDLGPKACRIEARPTTRGRTHGSLDRAGRNCAAQRPAETP